MQKRLTALIAGLLYPFAFAPYELWPLVILSIALFFRLLQGTQCKEAAWIGFCYGLGVFGYGVSWLYVSVHTYGGTPMWLAMPLTALFCATLALFMSLLGLLSARIKHHALAFVGLWCLVDVFRGWFLTGFPWLYPGYALIDTPLANLATIGGIWLVSMATVLSAVALATVRLWRQQWLYPAAAAFVWMVSLFISPQLWVKPTTDTMTDVALVQGNVPQDIKWLMTQQKATRQIYADLTESAINNATRPALVVWPESAITEFYQDAVPFLQAQGEIVAEKGGALISGVPWRINQMHGYEFYNSIAVVDGGQGVYHKQKLVPFGEYVPLEDVIRGAIPFFDLPMSSFTRGTPTQENLGALGLTIAPFICYEVLYPELVSARSHNADVMLTVSNDAWFGTSDGPWQHFQMTRMRTLETGRWLLRGTNNGVTAVIDANGKVRDQLPQFERRVLTSRFLPVAGETPFMHTGGWPWWLLAGLLCIPALRRSISSSHGEQSNKES